MKKYRTAFALTLALHLFSLLITTTHAKDKIISETVDLLPNTEARLTDLSPSGRKTSNHQRGDWMEFFESMGVEWPEGSYIRHSPVTGKLIVNNTPENMKRFREIMESLNVLPNQIEIEVQFVEFDLTDIDLLAQQGMVNTDSLRLLWKKGRGKLIAAPKVVTVSGAEAEVKGVSEYIYPTEFSAFIYERTNQANQVETESVVEPASFQTREVGSLLSVLPEVSPEGRMINLTVTPALVHEPTWKEYHMGKYFDRKGREKSLVAEQPFFKVEMVTTTVSIFNGATIMLGGGAAGREKGKIFYTFLSARIVDQRGNPIKELKMDKILK